MAVLFFEIVNCFQVAIEVGADVIPRIAGVMDFLVGPCVRKEHLATVGIDICESIQNMADKKESIQCFLELSMTYVRSSTGIKLGGNFRP